MNATHGTLATPTWHRRCAMVVGRCLGWVFLTQAYLDSLETESLLARGLGEGAARRWFREDGHRRTAAEGLLRRAEAHAALAGRRYRDGVQSEAVGDVLVAARLKRERDQEALLLPNLDPHLNKTPKTRQFRVPEPQP